MLLVRARAGLGRNGGDPRMRAPVRRTVDDSRWKRVEAVYQEVLDRIADDRESFLDAACQGDTVLRSEIDALLAQTGDDTNPRHAPVVEAGQRFYESTSKPLTPGTRLGPYEIVALIGRG